MLSHGGKKFANRYLQFGDDYEVPDAKGEVALAQVTPAQIIGDRAINYLPASAHQFDATTLRPLFDSASDTGCFLGHRGNRFHKRFRVASFR